MEKFLQASFDVNSVFFFGGKRLQFSIKETIMINDVSGNIRKVNKGELPWQKNY